MKGFFDNVSHGQLIELLKHRIADPRMLRLITKFLHAGVMIDERRYSLVLAPDKTKLLRFGRFAARDAARLGEGTPGTFDFLGFTHYCGRSQAGGNLSWTDFTAYEARHSLPMPRKITDLIAMFR